MKPWLQQNEEKIKPLMANKHGVDQGWRIFFFEWETNGILLREK